MKLDTNRFIRTLPVFLTTSAFWTCLIHTDALHLVGVSTPETLSLLLRMAHMDILEIHEVTVDGTTSQIMKMAGDVLLGHL